METKSGEYVRSDKELQNDKQNDKTQSEFE